MSENIFSKLPREGSAIEFESGDPRILSERCRNFLKQTIPLSEEGNRVSSKVRQALESESLDRITEIAKELPTVENLHLELFDDFHLTPEEKETVFGHTELSSVQITTGCSHQCEICGPPDKKLSFMPGVMIAKIGREVARMEEPVEHAWQDWVTHLKKLTGINIDTLGSQWYKDQMENGLSIEAILLIETIQQEFPRHPVSKYFDQPSGDPGDLSKLAESEDARSIFQRLLTYYPMNDVKFARDLYSYYDSDPFDWRDAVLKHEDGQPADLGDAFRCLAHPLRPVYISTTGWAESDPLGPIAARKIVEAVHENPYLMPRIRLSILAGERLAMKDPERYCQHMIRVIDGLKVIPMQIVFRYEEKDRDFPSLVRDPLLAHIEDLRSQLPEGHRETYFLVQPGIGGVSRWRWRNKNPEYAEDQDSAACMGGIHILPDGTVQRQAGSHRNRPPKGSRPQPIRLKLY